MKRSAIVMWGGIALASCGGGGSGSGLPIVSAPAPTPTPTPTPAPTPTPTAGVPAYTPYAQLVGDQSFKTACAALRYDFSPALPVPAAPFGSGPTLGYTSANQTYVVTPDARDSGLFGTQPRSYGPADRDATAPAGVLGYARTTNGFVERLTIGSNTAGGSSPDYVRGFSLRVPLYGSAAAGSPAAQYACVFGVPTRSDDLPTANVAYARGGLNGSATNYPASGSPESYAVTQSQVSVSVDWPANRLTVTIHMLGVLQTANGAASSSVDLGTYTGTATIDRTGSYGGQLASSDRSIRDASFAGWFFGPQASEAAFSIGFDSLDQATGRHIVFVGNALALR